MLCKICFDETESSQQKTLDCGHSFCENCIYKTIEVNVRRYDITMIRCPEHKCLKPLVHESILEILTQLGSEKIIKKYTKIKTDQKLLKNPQLCFCPNCQNLVEKNAAGKKNESIVFCVKCQNSFCFECNRSTHDDGVCPVKNSEGFETLTKNHKVLKCPDCQVCIEKIDGCNEMRCTFCRTLFCWICGRKKGNLHYSLLNPLGCPGQALHQNNGFKYFLLSLILVGLLSVSMVLVGMHLLRWNELMWMAEAVVACDVVVYVARKLIGLRLSEPAYLVLHIMNLMYYWRFKGLIWSIWQ